MFELLKNLKQRQSAERNLKIYNSMLDVADVKCGYDYWRKILLNKIIRMFKWEGLPDTIPQTELEKILLITGKVGIVPSEYGFIAVPVSPYGVGLYPTYYPKAIWATPLVEGDGFINQDVVVIRNNSFLTGIDETINRYARMLADIESSLALTLVNIRQPSMAAAPDEETARSYMSAALAIRLGDTEAVLNKSVLDDIKMLDAIKTIPATLLTDTINARDNLLSQFFAEFGVASRQSKKAPMTETEVESDTQIMTIAVMDMELSRKEAPSDLASVLGLEGVSVSLSPEFKPFQGHKPESFNKTGDPTTGQGVDE